MFLSCISLAERYSRLILPISSLSSRSNASSTARPWRAPPSMASASFPAWASISSDLRLASSSISLCSASNDMRRPYMPMPKPSIISIAMTNAKMSIDSGSTRKQHRPSELLGLLRDEPHSRTPYRGLRHAGSLWLLRASPPPLPLPQSPRLILVLPYYHSSLV